MKKDAYESTILDAEIAKGCPFCGSLAQIEFWHGGGPRKRMVSCSNEACHVSPEVSGSTRKAALAKWNHRVLPAKVEIKGED